jgi:ABC-type multidrug transport system fused ATPase/permease subunit
MLVPTMIVVAGWIIELLYLNPRDRLPESISLGEWLKLPTQFMGSDASPLRGLLVLIGLMVGLALLEAFVLSGLYSWVIRYTVDLDVWLRRQLFLGHIGQAEKLGISCQSTSWQEADTHLIPQIREGVTAWYRSFHRYSVQAVLCFAAAAMIHPLLMLATFLAFLIIWQIYRALDRKRRRRQPVLIERSEAQLAKLRGLSKIGPQLVGIYSSNAVDERVSSLLRSYRDIECKLGYDSVHRTPLLLGAITLIAGVLCAILSVQVVRPENAIDIAAVLAMIGLIAFGYLSILRIIRAIERRNACDMAAGKLLGLLPSDQTPEAGPIRFPAFHIVKSFELEKATLSDASGRLVLSEIDLWVRPGSIVALVSVPKQSALSLAELISGYGQPSSGRILWDGVPITSIQLRSLDNLRAWIDPTGPVVAGTVAECLSPANPNRPTAELVEAVREVGLYETIAELPDSFSTFISFDDDRLKGDALFRLGMARALLTDARLIVAQEPTETSTSAKGGIVDALRVFTRRNGIVFILPQSGATLRAADRVILMSDGKIADEGKHTELLERSELYRHLNYMLYSPFRGISVE